MAEARRAETAASASIAGAPGLWSAVQKRVRLSDRWVDLLSALLLSLAALTSAVCAYRAAWWASEQSSYTIDMTRARGQAGVRFNTAGQLAAFDAGMFIQYAEAVTTGNSELAEFLYNRFRPEMKVALDAWLATRPLINPDAPSSPFVMPEYVLPERVEAEALAARADNAETNARESNTRSTRYVGITAMAAVALFLGGISSKFPTRGLRAGLLALAWAVWLSTFGYLIAFAISVEPLAGAESLA
jgi:hypothetical protein